MTKGVPLARDARMSHATVQAKAVLVQTKSWFRTKQHLQQWLRITYNLSSNSIRDYIATIELRLAADPETKKMMDPQLKVQMPPTADNFTKASEL